MSQSLPNKKSSTHIKLSLASVLWVAFMWFTPWQTQDGPNHQKVAEILSRLSSSPLESQVYQSNLGFFQTNELFPLLYTWLLKIIPDLNTETYEKTFVTLSILALWWSYLYFLKVFSPKSEKLVWLVLPLSFHLLFVQGMYNFMASIALTLLALTWLKQGIIHKKNHFLLLFILVSYVAFLTHPFPSFILGPALFFITLFAKGSRIRTLPYWLITIGLFIPGFLVSLISTAQQSTTTSYLWKWPWENMGGLFAFNFPLYSIPQAIGLIPFFLLLVFLAACSCQQVAWKDKIFWLCFLALYFIFPNEGSGGAHLNLRFLPFVWLCLPLGLQPSPKLSRFAVTLSILTTLYLGTSVTVAMQQMKQMRDNLQTVSNSLPKNKMIQLYPINFNLHGPAINYTSLMHLWAYYPKDRVVFSPYLFAFSDLMPLSKRTNSPLELKATPEDFAKEKHRQNYCLGIKRQSLDLETCQQKRLAAWRKIFSQAKNYDYWWVYQGPQDFLSYLKDLPGLSQVTQQGTHSLWHYKKAPKTPKLRQSLP